MGYLAPSSRPARTENPPRGAFRAGALNRLPLFFVTVAASLANRAWFYSAEENSSEKEDHDRRGIVHVQFRGVRREHKRSGRESGGNVLRGARMLWHRLALLRLKLRRRAERAFDLAGRPSCPRRPLPPAHRTPLTIGTLVNFC